MKRKFRILNNERMKYDKTKLNIQLVTSAMWRSLRIKTNQKKDLKNEIGYDFNLLMFSETTKTGNNE